MEFGPTSSGTVFADQNELEDVNLPALSAPGHMSASDQRPQASTLDFSDESLFTGMNCQANEALMSLVYPTQNAFSTSDGYMNAAINRADSHCVLACTQVIDRLERYLFDKLTTLDIVLDIVKKYLGSLQRLNQHTTTLSFSSKSLFFVIMHQIVSLLEGGCQNFQREKSIQKQLSNDLWNTASNKPLPMFPMIGLGAFEIDPDEQHLWRSQVILKESNRSLEVVGNVTASIGSDCDSGCCPRSWSRDLERRIRALCDSLKKRKVRKCAWSDDRKLIADAVFTLVPIPKQIYELNFLNILS